MSDFALPGLTVHHFSVSVPDIESAAAWYHRVLGFSVEKRFEIAAIPAKGAFLVRNSLRIELWQLPGNEVPASRRAPDTDLQVGGMKHIAFRVSNLSERLTQLIAMGVDVAATQRAPTEPMAPWVPGEQPAGDPIFAAFIRDPFGVLIELLDDQGLAALG